MRAGESLMALAQSSLSCPEQKKRKKEWVGWGGARHAHKIPRNEAAARSGGAANDPCQSGDVRGG